MSEWRPLDTAPRDGTPIWLGGAAVRKAKWFQPKDDEGFWQDIDLTGTGKPRRLMYAPVAWLPTLGTEHDD